MRLINVMTIVCLLLVLAMIPALVDFNHLIGAPRSASLAVYAGIIAILVARRV